MLTADLSANLAREIRELEAAGHRLLVQASTALRSGRTGWEPWFEAGMELQEAAKRLRQFIRTVNPALAELRLQERKRRG